MVKKLSRSDKLSIKLGKKKKLERVSGIGSKGRKSSFEKGVYVGSQISSWGGLSKIPKYISNYFPKPPKSKVAKEDYHLGIIWGSKNR